MSASHGSLLSDEANWSVRKTSSSMPSRSCSRSRVYFVVLRPTAMRFRAVASWKVFSPISVTLAGRIRVSSAVQLWNMYSPTQLSFSKYSSTP